MKNDREWREWYFNKMYAWITYDKNLHYDLKVQIKKRQIYSLYKYRSGTENDIINLENNKLMAAKYNKFNDPFEFINRLDINSAITTYGLLEGKDFSEIKPLIMNDTLSKNHGFWSFYDKVMDSVEEYKKSFNICCLSEKKDSLLMWSHYANEHKGFCIEYNISEMFDMHPLLCPILYSEFMPLFANGDNELVNLSKMLYTKSTSWEYEREWRITCNGDEEFKLIPTPKPTSIYVGCRIERELFEKLFLFCKNNNVRLFRSIINRLKYQLDFEEILID